MGRRIKLTVAVVLVVIAIPAGRWVRHTRPWESATKRVHRLCGECGLTAAETNRMIDQSSHPTLIREQALRSFYATFDNDADSRLCRPCAEAILDAAGVAASCGE